MTDLSNYYDQSYPPEIYGPPAPPPPDGFVLVGRWIVSPATPVADGDLVFVHPALDIAPVSADGTNVLAELDALQAGDEIYLETEGGATNTATITTNNGGGSFVIGAQAPTGGFVDGESVWFYGEAAAPPPPGETQIGGTWLHTTSGTKNDGEWGVNFTTVTQADIADTDIEATDNSAAFAALVPGDTLIVRQAGGGLESTGVITAVDATSDTVQIETDTDLDYDQWGGETVNVFYVPATVQIDGGLTVAQTKAIVEAAGCDRIDVAEYALAYELAHGNRATLVSWLAGFIEGCEDDGPN